MELTALWFSIIVNAMLVTVLLFGFIELRKTRDRLFRKDGFIRHTKSKLHEAQEEIHRKETVILREKGKGKWTIEFFTEVDIAKKFFGNKSVIRYRFQLLHNGIPVGPSGIVKQDICTEVDKEQVNQILQDFAKPMFKHGLEVAIRKFLG